MTYKLDDILELSIKNPSWEVIGRNQNILIIKMSLGSPNNNSMSVTFLLRGYDGSDQITWVENKLKELEVK